MIARKVTKRSFYKLPSDRANGQIRSLFICNPFGAAVQALTMPGTYTLVSWGRHSYPVTKPFGAMDSETAY